MRCALGVAGAGRLGTGRFLVVRKIEPQGLHLTLRFRNSSGIRPIFPHFTQAIVTMATPRLALTELGFFLYPDAFQFLQRARSTDHCQVAEQDLAAVVDALPELREAIRAGILAVVRAAGL